MVCLETPKSRIFRHPLGEQLCLQPGPTAAPELAPVLLGKPLWSRVALLGERLLVFLEDGPLPPELTRLWQGCVGHHPDS